MTPRTFRHLTGLRAGATALAGAGLAGGGARCLALAARGEPGWAFWAAAGPVLLAAGALVLTLPWRLTARLDAHGVSVGWALGRVRVPWGRVRRVVIATLGSGGERDPVTVTLLLRDGREVLYATVGRRRPETDPACAALLEAARGLGIPVEDVLATPEEIKDRMKKWREARIRGWR